MEPTTTLVDERSARRGWPLVAAEIATERLDRRRGLLGRDHFDRVLVLCPARQIHTFGMRFAIDVAWCDAAGEVLRIETVAPNRLSAWVFGAHAVLETGAGMFSVLDIGVGDRLGWLPATADGTPWIIKY